ncbi:MAG TPA: hypothetical protein VHR45_08490 [Thermoanaerobaculia bacterium]|nr:hypothetical protein [Thermoanaerobaculia bacterium]
MDTVPAATLLLPYFEVNLDDPNGLTTLFSINNSAAAAVLAHAVIWSDLAVPLFNFDVYLTGYDVQTINLRDILFYGRLPQTADAAEDPNDTISPRGRLSQDVAFPGCQGQLPPPPLAPAALAHLQSALTGKPSPLLGNRCAGQALGDNVARGYITVDTVGKCTPRFPGEPGYLGPGGDLTDQNVLWGAWTIVDAAHNFAQGSDLAAIEADGADPATSIAGRYSFYGRYDGWSAADHREPLATLFAAQFSNGGAFEGGTDLIVWRDPKVAQGAFPCPAGIANPAWYPRPQENIVLFDEQEHPFTSEVIRIPEPPAGSDLLPFPAATQRVHVNSAQFPVPFNFGWLYLDLNAPTVPGSPPNPPIDPLAAQAWVVAVQSSHGHFAVALDAFRLDSGCAAGHSSP